MNNTRQITLCAAVTLLCTATATHAAEKLIATETIADFDLSVAPVVRNVDFTATEPVTGIGFTAQWTAVVADNGGGTAPWSLDLNPVVQAPTGETIDWPVVGGDRTIADYPLQDFSGPGLPSVNGTGTFVWTFNNSAPQAPYTMGLRDVQLHLTTTVPDVVEVRNDTTDGGPLWNRPFFIEGISGLGPVHYHLIEFEVTVSGGYSFESVVPTGDNFTCLYRGSFNPGDPDTPGDTGQLENLLDYGLGNGFAPNDTPQGTSLIEAMLFEGERYYYVTSQWASFRPAQEFTTTITGPAAIDDDLNDCPADLTDDGTSDQPDGAVNLFDLLLLIDNWGANAAGAAISAEGGGSEVVDLFDLLAMLDAWGKCE